MTAAWVTIGALAVSTFAIKAAGPVIFGGRALPARVTGVIELLPSAMLAALVVVETFSGPSGGLEFDARAAGLLAAGVAVICRGSILVVIVVAAAAAALTRLLT